MKSRFYTLLSMFKFTLPDYSDLRNNLHSSCSNFSRNETPQRQRRFTGSDSEIGIITCIC